MLYSIKKVKELPEKAALELTGDDILIIEDEYNTCQIKLSELSTYIRNGLIDKDGFNKLMTEALADLLIRLDKAESVYPFKINSITKTLSVNLPGKEQEISDSYIYNQNNIEIELIKKTINEYDLIVTEKTDLNSYYSGGSITDEHKWYGIIIEFNTNNEYITYDKTQSSGNWAEMYSIDESEKTDVFIFSDTEDTNKISNSIIVWLRADDDNQTFCFVDGEQSVKSITGNDIMDFNDSFNTIKLNVSVNKYVPEIIEEPEEEIHTYAVYQWDNILGTEPNISVKNNTLYFEFNGNIPYTSQVINNIYTSGNYIGITITPPISFDTSNQEYPKLYYDGVLEKSGWKNFFEQDEEGNVLTDNISKANLSLAFTDLKRNVLCTIDWGIGYIDNVMITTENGTLLYPPINNL